MLNYPLAGYKRVHLKERRNRKKNIEKVEGK